ncbi:MAG: tetratricopeptide repeat protein, partial [Thiotrichaceae bacterium]|nr:tetratricopeptide repeat protein [Thiotrichaceae bacterium]
KAGNKDPVLYNFLSVIENLKGNKDKAKQAYHKALTADKNFIPAYMGLAKFAYSEGNEKEAVSYFKQVTEINKHYLASYLALASIAEKNNNNKQAEQYLLSALKHNKGNLQVQLKISSLLAKWYAKFKQPEKLLTLADDLIRQYPEDPSALSFLARAQIINGKNKAAEKTLENIVRKNNKDSKHRILLANLIAKQPGRQEEVLSLLEEVYNNDTSKPQGLIFQVNYLIKHKKYHQAMEIAKRIDFLFPDKASGKKLQGDIFWAQDQKDKAISLYREAYQKQPGVKALFSLSQLMFKDGKTDLAIQFLNEELAANPQDKPEHRAILFKLAFIYQQLKQNDKAIVYYERILAIQEDNPLALNNLAWIYYTQKNPEAIKLAEKAYLKAPGSAGIADTYAVILLEQPEQADKALKILQQAAKQSANDYNIQFHLAQSYVLSGNEAEA